MCTWKSAAIPFSKFSSVKDLFMEAYMFFTCPLFQCKKNGWFVNPSILDLRPMNWRWASCFDFFDHVWSLGDLNYGRKKNEYGIKGIIRPK